MKGFVRNIEKLAKGNDAFRRVLYTARNCQLVVMSLKPAEEIGTEVHKLDQFFRVEEGTGRSCARRRDEKNRPRISAWLLLPGRGTTSSIRARRRRAVHALCAAQPKRWRRACNARRCPVRQRNLRRQDNRVIFFASGNRLKASFLHCRRITARPARPVQDKFEGVTACPCA